MNGGDDENPKELFERFFNTEQAERAIEDVEKAEQILFEYPAPEPDKELIADIKSVITARLLRRQKSIFRNTVYRVTAIAAAVIIVASVSLNLFERTEGPGQLEYAAIIPRAIWESNDIAADDVDLAILTAEIEQIEEEVLALQFAGNAADTDEAIMELEMELIEIDSDFWKG